MATLQERIAEYEITKRERVPAEVLSVMDRTTRDLAATGIAAASRQAGDRAPAFELDNHLGERRTLSALLADGPLVLSFYRGGWCPYCNLELQALQAALPQIQAAGAQLVAVSPELPDKSLSTRERNELAFEVLHDAGNRVAASFGLVFTLAEELRPIYDSFGLDLPDYNGDDSFTLPMPATYVIGRDAGIHYAFVDADYTKRLEPALVLDSLARLA